MSNYLDSSSDTICDEELASDARENVKSFSLLYQRYFPQIYRYVHSTIGIREDVEDITSEIFEKLLNKINTFNKSRDTSFKTWIYKIARNTLIDVYRKKTVRRIFTVIVADENGASDQSVKDNEEDIEEEKEKKEVIRSLVQRLPSRQREIITLRYYCDLSNKEIAELLHIDQRTVGSLIYKSVARIRTEYTSLNDVN